MRPCGSPLLSRLPLSTIGWRDVESQDFPLITTWLMKRLEKVSICQSHWLRYYEQHCFLSPLREGCQAWMAFSGTASGVCLSVYVCWLSRVVNRAMYLAHLATTTLACFLFSLVVSMTWSLFATFRARSQWVHHLPPGCRRMKSWSSSREAPHLHTPWAMRSSPLSAYQSLLWAFAFF